MMRNIKRYGLWALLFGSVCAFAAPTVTQDDARKSAEQIWQRKDSFSATLQAAIPRYQEWLKQEQLYAKQKGIVFGPMRQGKQPDGNQSFTIEIDAGVAAPTAVTVRLPGNSVALLNDAEVAQNNRNNETNDPQVIPLNLKKGKNIFVINVVKYNRDFRYNSFFRPYADPSVELKNIAWSQYGSCMACVPKRIELDIFVRQDYYDLFKDPIVDIIERSTFSAGKFEKLYKQMVADKLDPKSPKWLDLFSDAAATSEVEARLGFDIKNLRAAIDDLTKKGAGYPSKYTIELKKWETDMPAMLKALYAGDNSAGGKLDAYKTFAREALLANPVLKKYENWVYIVRKNHDGLPTNWQGNATMHGRNRWKDEIWTMKLSDPSSAKLLFSSSEAPAVTDMEIDWDGKKIMFSSLDEKDRWQLYEIKADGSGLKMLTPGIHDGVDSFDGVYLPNGKIIFCYTACHVGVPCVSGSDYVANLYIMDPNAGSPEKVDKSIRQLTFEQDADWMPTVMNDGRVMYTRWEYTDNSHYFSRILMRMDPDGRSQSAWYGSTSYWPNSIFYSRPIPDSPTKFISIVTGHHGISRSGELHLFDTSKGTIEDSGRVHKFPSFGREYVAEIKDELINGKWPQIIHPYPLSEDLVVASIRTPRHGFNLYLIDKFDNMVELMQSRGGERLFEPMPLVARTKPKSIPDLVTPALKKDPKLDKGKLFLNDIYQGPGLAGVPRGEVKALRVFEYDYAYRNMGSHNVIGHEGSWDVKRLWGTVPVEEDGSALFELPANRPIAIQPLDKEGKALALMRSWLTVMPGETQSCVGCHEGQGMTPVSKPALASRKKPSVIKEFRAPVRGFSFVRDVQPTLDKYCVGCHDGKDSSRPDFRNVPGFRHFSAAYKNLHPYIRRSGPESNQNLLSPSEFNANTSELVQMLKKGHKGVEMDDEAWRILYTWIDMNVPFLGSWKEVQRNIPNNGDTERMKFLALYANRFDDQDAITWFPNPETFVAPKTEKRHTGKEPTVKGFPFDENMAKKLVDNTKLPKEIAVEMRKGVIMRFVLVPAGAYVMGTNDFFYDEGPAQAVKVETPFYMAQFETSNEQYNVFDPKHHSGYQDRLWKDHVNQGYVSHNSSQPVIRVSWNDVKGFCDWFSKTYGVEVTLPTEKQWEWAARAGSEKDFWFGAIGSDFSAYENFSDVTTKKFDVEGVDPQPRRNPRPEDAFLPADLNFNDGELIAADVGAYAPSPFNLYDINGNIAEWTLDTYTKTLGGEPVEGSKVVRGGSWRDRPSWARVTLRRNYPAWQRIYNVGFRIVINDVAKAAEVFKPVAPLPEKPLKFGRGETETKIDLTPFMSANPKDLIVNGDFQYPDIPESVQMVARGQLPGWDSKEGSFEVWNEGAHGSPKQNTMNQGTRQHLEIASNGNAPFEVWQTFVVPKKFKKTSATLSFEAWPRNNTNACEVIVYINGKEKHKQKLIGAPNRWTKNNMQVREVSGGDTVKVMFRETGDSAGWHIDSVSFLLR